MLNNGIPQGSISGPLLDICDLFLWDYKCDTASYADDNTPYTPDVNLNTVLEKLKNSTRAIFR